jgi:thymidylate synthase
MKLINLHATDLPDAWFQVIYALLEHGREFKIDRGSYAGQSRLELDYVTVHIDEPFLRDTEGWPLIPEMPVGCNMPAPTSKEYLADYAKYIMTGEKQPGEGYTYGSRLWHYRCCEPREGEIPLYLKQVPAVIETYKRHGHRTNQMVLQIAQPNDLLLPDPPCLRHVDTRIQDNKLHFFIYFRSWDAWGGFPANLAGLSMLQEYMASEIGVEPGEFVCSSKGLHLYDYAVPFAELRCMKSQQHRN